MKKVLTFNRRLRRRQNFSPHQPQIGDGAKWPISAMVVGQAPFAPPPSPPGLVKDFFVDFFCTLLLCILHAFLHTFTKKTWD